MLDAIVGSGQGSLLSGYLSVPWMSGIDICLMISSSGLGPVSAMRSIIRLTIFVRLLPRLLDPSRPLSPRLGAGVEGPALVPRVRRAAGRGAVVGGDVAGLAIADGVRAGLAW